MAFVARTALRRGYATAAESIKVGLGDVYTGFGDFGREKGRRREEVYEDVDGCRAECMGGRASHRGSSELESIEENAKVA